MTSISPETSPEILPEISPEQEAAHKSGALSALRRFLERYSLDVRSLALLRIGLAITLIASAFSQSNLPGALLIVKALWLAASLASAAAMLFGFHSRLATVAAWLTLVAVSGDPLMTFSSDSLLQSVMLWAMFLPLGAAYSVDRAMNTATRPVPLRFVSVAVIALIAQQFVSFATALSVAGSGKISLSLFAVMTCLAFIPTIAWEFLGKEVYGFKGKGIERTGVNIFYDADCGFCKKVVHLIRMLLVLPHTPLATAQSIPEINEAMETQNSWVIVDWQGNHHYRFEAIAYVVSLSPVFNIFASLLRLPPIMTIGTHFYKWVANNRKTAGRFTRPFKFKPLIVRNPAWLNGLALLLLGIRLFA